MFPGLIAVMTSGMTTSGISFGLTLLPQLGGEELVPGPAAGGADGSAARSQGVSR
jgi:hypothetical protein